MIPDKIFDSSKQLSELTRSYLDKSDYFKKLIDKEFHGNPSMLLGELQVAFILFLVGENLEAFEQFKRVFALLTNAESYLLANTVFALNAIRAIYTCLSQFPEDFFLDPISSHNFVQPGLKSLFAMDFQGAVLDRCNKLRSMVRERFHLEFREFEVVDGELYFDEDDDEAPVVVDLNKKLIRFDDD